MHWASRSGGTSSALMARLSSPRDSSAAMLLLRGLVQATRGSRDARRRRRGELDPREKQRTDRQTRN